MKLFLLFLLTVAAWVTFLVCAVRALIGNSHLWSYAGASFIVSIVLGVLTILYAAKNQNKVGF